MERVLWRKPQDARSSALERSDMSKSDTWKRTGAPSRFHFGRRPTRGVIKLLNHLFSAFDELSDANGIFKVPTHSRHRDERKNVALGRVPRSSLNRVENPSNRNSETHRSRRSETRTWRRRGTTSVPTTRCA